jgi:L-malate glycosyltransferase
MTEQSVVFVWENFGPVHADRCDAVARHFGDRREVHGIELAGSSQVYAWNSQDGAAFQKHTLFPAAAAIYKVPFFKKAAALLRACWARRPADFFFCNYDSPLIFCTALTLRLTGARVFVMNDSKFDDYRRYLPRELVKRLFYLPYNGAIASAARAADYLRFLGVPESHILSHYDTMSTERIRRLAGVARAPGGPPFAARHFTIVARLVEKKNISMALRAYALYRAEAPRPRQLHICGSGPLEARLRAEAVELGLGDSVAFRGFLQIEEICPVLGKTLALLLVSAQEQFGNVVIEAQALGAPVIVSDNCGARDMLVRNGVNGFVVEPDNPAGLAFFMGLLDRDEALWRRMALASEPFAALGDAAHFARAVAALTGARSKQALAPGASQGSPGSPQGAAIADRLRDGA